MFMAVNAAQSGGSIHILPCDISPGSLLSRLCLLVLLLLAAAPFSPHAEAETAAWTSSRFHRTVLYLDKSAAEERAAFAIAALSQLAEVYMAEADLARARAQRNQGNDRAKLYGWSVAVDGYANQLLLLLDDIEEGYPVKLLQSREGAVTVRVAGRAVMLGHPRPGQQAAFEQRVLADFCAGNDCRRMTASASEVGMQSVPLSGAPVNPNWSFSERGSLCAHGGIELLFDSANELAASRQFCKELLREAADLAAEISWQERHGVVVDWSALSITSTPRGPQHLVGLNDSGDSVLISTPLLFSSPGLLDDLKPWLQGQSSGAQGVTVQLSAASYGWKVAGK